VKTGELWMDNWTIVSMQTCWLEASQTSRLASSKQQSREWWDWNGSTAKKISFAPKIQNQDP
jgi:hypothetical protein